MGTTEQEVKRLEGNLERLKELYVEGWIRKSEYNRQSERYKKQLAEAKGRPESIAPNLSKHEQRLAKIDKAIDLVREGSLEEHRKVLDALIELVEEKDGQIERVTFREWTRGLLDE
ncbi:MAG: hypothetical protein HZB51_20455 [Chloroflexi bacterium]|nr:hypothetical protein [Chloroflexota bacterium]